MIENILKNEIKKNGIISFERFMETCLYHEKYGYYMKKLYTEDYLTPQYVTNLYGKILFKFFENFLKKLNKSVLVEIGAGEGILAKHILDAAKKEGVDLRYIIVERSEFLLNRAKALLEGYDVEFHKNLKGLNNISGIIFSNELFDSLPVRIFKRINNRIYELYLNENLEEVYIEVNDSIVNEYLRVINVSVPNNFKFEINLKAIDMLREISKKLSNGYLVTIDYGYSADELFKEYRKEGNVICHYRRNAHYNPYINLGNQDITCLVNFTSLIKYGEKFSLKCIMFKSLKDIINDIISEEFLTKYINNIKKKFEFLYLLLNFGDKYKVLVQKKI